MRGATLTLEDKAQLWLISIHAPHARSDQFLVLDIIKILPFQSTLLMRGATRQRQHRRHSSQFQSTLLMRGATRCYYPSCHHSNKFQSTLLMRGATKRHPKPGKTLCISIHAPHARSDIHYPWPDRRTMRISIHAPHARSDGSYLEFGVNEQGISIHAPHARSDALHEDEALEGLLFQSTLLMRGATRVPLRLRFTQTNFNPRSSCEERLPVLSFNSHCTNFNPRSSCEERRTYLG